MRLISKNRHRFTSTMAAPAGIEYRQDSIMPITKHATEITADETSTCLN